MTLTCTFQPTSTADCQWTPGSSLHHFCNRYIIDPDGLDARISPLLEALALEIGSPKAILLCRRVNENQDRLFSWVQDKPIPPHNRSEEWKLLLASSPNGEPMGTLVLYPSQEPGHIPEESPLFKKLVCLLQELLSVLTFTRVQREMNQKLSSLNQSFLDQALFAEMGQNCGRLFHELRNSAALLSGKVILARRAQETSGNSSPRTLDHMSSIQEATHHLLQLLEKSKELAGSFDLGGPTASAIRLRDLVTELVHSLGVAKICQVDVDIPEELTIVWDKAGLSHVLMNLLNNAADILQCAPQRRIWLSTQLTKDALELRIADSGKGIPTEFHDRIFKSFFSTKTPNKGSGIGLTICRDLMDRRGGKIWLDSTAQRTTFVLEFPKNVLLQK